VVLHDYALYKSTFTLLYFTLINSTLNSRTKRPSMPKFGRKVP